jgi:DsbC/DsbD-like thiol-disulfide interchange protein
VTATAVLALPECGLSGPRFMVEERQARGRLGWPGRIGRLSWLGWLGWLSSAGSGERMGLRIDQRILGSAPGAAMARSAAAACWALGLLTPLAPLALLALIAEGPAAAAASPWISNPQSQLRLISGDSVAPRHGELRLGVQFRVAPKWHVYWKNSGDAGFAPVVTWRRAPGLAPPELLWPAPHRFELPGGLEAFGYAGEVVYPVRAAVDAAPGTGLLRLSANVDYLVCEVDCIPYRYDLSLDQPLGERAQADPETAPVIDSWWRQVPLAGTRGVATQTALTSDGPAALRLELRLRGVNAAPGGADLFFETHPALELGRPRVVAAPGELRFEAPVRRKDSSVPLPAGTEIAWTATGLEQTGRPLPLALAARQWVQIGVQIGVPIGVPIGGQIGVPTGVTAPPRLGVRASLAAADPRASALGVVAAALLTLAAWGLLGRRRPAARREAAGFLALLLTLALLYALSLEISAEGLAGVELALLAMALAAWVRRQIDRPAMARMLLAAALIAFAIVPPWLAGRNRLAGDRPAATGMPAAGAAAAAAPARSPA